MSENQNEKNIKCVFCKIIQGECPSGTIVYENDTVVVFKDIKPASDYHYLAVPRDHIENAKVLKDKDKVLLNEMKDALTNVLTDNNVDMNDVSFGFHWPPFTSISHLHLHGIAPVSKMGFLQRIIFRPNNIWYCSFDDVLKKIDKKPS